MQSAASMLTEEAEGCIALENGFLPQPEWTLLGLISRDELANMLQQVERKVAGLHIGEEVKIDCLPKDPGCDPFLDQDGAGAVLRLVDLWCALALEPKERPNDGRPGQHGDVGEVENVMEAIV